MWIWLVYPAEYDSESFEACDLVVVFFLRLANTYSRGFQARSGRPVALWIRARWGDHAASYRQHLVLCVRRSPFDVRHLGLLWNFFEMTGGSSVRFSFLFWRLSERHHASVTAVTAHRSKVSRDLDCLHQLVLSRVVFLMSFRWNLWW